jgi:general secretion pathway protein D
MAPSVALAAAVKPAVRLTLLPARLMLEPGAVFTLEVRAAANRPLSHLPLTLTFDPAVLAVEHVEPGDYFGGAGEGVVLSDSSRPGTVILGASRLGTVAGVTGEGTVARVSFRALAAGGSKIELKGSRALDPALQPLLPLRTRPARIEVKGAVRPWEA